MRFALALVLALVFGGSAQAATPFELYEQGKFDAAVAAGLAANDAAGLAVAARATLAAETMRGARCLDCIKRAEDYARRAIRNDPRNADAHVFLAVALGREGRLESVFTVLRKGYPTLARHELDAAIAADPRHAQAWAALGGWNIEIVRKGGKAMAKMMYGATPEAGFAAFDKALVLAPGDVGLLYQYALTLSAYDADTYRAKIADALARSANGTPRSAYEAFAQTRARELLAALQKGDRSAYAALVARDQGAPN